jgi:proton-coupled amino acid transporter
LFEGSITLCIPLQEALQDAEAEMKFPVVYNQTISSIVLFYTFFGFICWSAFGDDVSTVLTTSLPEGVLATSVQLAYSIAVIFTFPLQIFPALEIIVHVVERRLPGDIEGDTFQLTSYQRSIVTTLVIITLSIIAVVEMDNLGKVVALMGSLLGCPLAFVFPPLIHSKIVPNAPRSNQSISCIGILAMIGATSITLATWSESVGERRRLDVSSMLGLG